MQMSRALVWPCLYVPAADESGQGAHVEAPLAMSGSVRLSLGEMADKEYVVDAGDGEALGRAYIEAFWRASTGRLGGERSKIWGIIR